MKKQIAIISWVDAAMHGDDTFWEIEILIRANERALQQTQHES